MRRLTPLEVTRLDNYSPETQIRFHVARQVSLTPEQRDRVALELERLFPWLGTDDEIQSGADECERLALYHSTLLARWPIEESHKDGGPEA